MESTCQGRVTRCNNKSGCSALWCEVVWCGVENAMRSLSPYGWRTLPQFQSCSSAKVSSRSRTQLLCYISGASAHFLATALPLQSSEKRGEKKKNFKKPILQPKNNNNNYKTKPGAVLQQQKSNFVATKRSPVFCRVQLYSELCNQEKGTLDNVTPRVANLPSSMVGI